MGAAGDVEMKLRYNVIPELKQVFMNSIREVFEDVIVPKAQELSPRDTGDNAASIDSLVRDQGAIGIIAAIFTQSGYGGYLELGHRVRGDSGKIVEGRPYIYPAVMASMPKLFEIMQVNLASYKNGGGL